MEALFLKTAENGQKTPLGEFVTIGSGPQCQIRINADSISERHARIEHRNGIYYLKDLNSAAGTFVNQTRILEAPIQAGDLISFGKNEFHVESNLVKSTKSSLLSAQSFKLTSKNESWSLQLKAIPSLAKSLLPALILGPSGTGKEHIARALHDFSSRSHGPYVAVNCSALTETLIESELFGHVKGAFTGASQDRKGAFEAARGGTLFLDEIGDLPLSMQAKLLRALENNEIRPVGSDQNIKTDVRIVSATHQNLQSKVQSGEFRSDLYFRLNVVAIKTPALVERLEDFEDILFEFAKEYRIRISHDTIQELKLLPWPGNIRQLKNFVARASATYQENGVEKSNLSFLLDESLTSQQPQNVSYQSQQSVIKQIEKELIIKRMYANRGNQRATARDLGLPKSTLHDRLKSYGLDARNFIQMS